MEGTLGNERLKHTPHEVTEGSHIYHHDLVLALGTVLEAITHIALGDGELEVVCSQSLHISDHCALVSVALPLALQPDLQVVYVVIAVLFNILYLVNLEVGSAIEQYHPAIVIVTEEGIELSKGGSTSILWMSLNI